MALALTWNAFETHQELYPRFSEIVLVLAILLVGKFIFDYIATARSFDLSLLLAYPISWLDKIASPFLNFSDWLTRLAKGPRARKAQSDRVSADDIQIIMAEGRRAAQDRIDGPG